jgi:hypothetical protein
VNADRRKQQSSKFQIALVALIPFLCAAGARADSYDVTVMNATFTAECVGDTGTCTEVVNGSAVYDDVANELSDISFQLTGTLNASLDGSYTGAGTNPCIGSPNCLSPDLVYDLDAVSTDFPIEFALVLPTLDAPTPEPIEGGPGNTELFIPATCGGDQPNCDTTGVFPGGADYLLTSGTYTAVDESSAAPEPGSVTLFVTGLAMLGFLSHRVLARTAAE